MESLDGPIAVTVALVMAAGGGLLLYAAVRGGRHAYRTLPPAERRRTAVVWALAVPLVIAFVVVMAVVDADRREMAHAVAYVTLGGFALGIAGALVIAFVGVAKASRRRLQRRR